MNPNAFLARLAEPTRFALVRRLADGAATVNEMTDGSGHSQSNVSHHLKQLRDCGVVVYEREGRSNRYALSHPVIAEFVRAVERASLTLAECNTGACA